MCSAESRVGQKAEFSFTSLRFSCYSLVCLARGFVDHMSGADTVRWLFVVINASPFFFFSHSKCRLHLVEKAPGSVHARQFEDLKLNRWVKGSWKDRPTILSGANRSCLFHLMEWEKQHNIECSRVHNPETHTWFFRFRFRLRVQKCDLNGKKGYVLFWYGEGRFD